MLLSLSSSIILLSINRSTISYNYPVVTSYKSVSLILVSSNLEVVAAVNSVVTGAFGGILFDFFYRNHSSNYVTISCRSTTIDALIG